LSLWYCLILQTFIRQLIVSTAIYLFSLIIVTRGIGFAVADGYDGRRSRSTLGPTTDHPNQRQHHKQEATHAEEGHHAKQQPMGE
jgi:hypothetical protein